MSQPESKTFEESLDALEERVRSLESANLPLDRALTLFEEGVGLARTCHEHLEAAEKRVAALSRGASGVVEDDFDDIE